MSESRPPSIPAGWYPQGPGIERWWDGTAWTEHTRTAPARPEPPAPAPAAHPAAHQPDKGAGGFVGFSAAGPQTGPPSQAPGQAAQQKPASPIYVRPATSIGLPPVGGPAGQAPPGGFGRAPGTPGAAPAPGPGGFGPPPKQKSSHLLGFAIGGGLAVVAIIALVLVLVLRGGGPEEPAVAGDAVVEDYVDSIADLDFESMCDQLSTEQQQEFLDDADSGDCQEAADTLEESIEEVTYDEVDEVREELSVDLDVEDYTPAEDFTTATVTVEGSVEYSYYDPVDVDTEVELVNVEGAWQISDYGDLGPDLVQEFDY